MLLKGEELETLVCLLTRVMADPERCPIAPESAYTLRDRFEAELDHHTGPSRWAVYVDITQ